MIITDRYKYVYRKATNKNELYDLEKGPQETTNLIDKCEYEKIQTELHSKLVNRFNNI